MKTNVSKIAFIGLIASGATAPMSLSQNRRRFRHLQQHARLSIPYLVQTEHGTAKLFAYLHRQILRRFETRLATLLGLPIAIVETPMHAYIHLNTRPNAAHS